MQTGLETPGSEKIREYLLGKLADEVRAEVELRLLDDKEFFDELLILEDELVDDYVAGRLRESDRTQFENHFLNAPERQARLRFGRVFNRYLELNDSAETDIDRASTVLPRSVNQDRWKPRLFQHRWAVVSVSVVLVFVAATYWLLSRGGTNLESGQKIVSLSLMPGAVRSGGTSQRIEITREVGSLQLELGLAAIDFSTYHAQVMSEGKTVNVLEGLKPISTEGRHYVVVSLDPLPSGDYQVRLSGVSSSGQLEALNTYNFRVVRS
jgi:hypothetical protein